ncbi:hypothetical protein L1987_39423 [Smallanthus sonchifolius]|uniref:Uncharacterized protein n=1 Tax=Smallanthus sonchifolius TaxID=185202 RepID=A0ACB9HN66_9ASTR|nr:hypothetical protein L1987_39423 [Smallanthus sonchifolius]
MEMVAFLFQISIMKKALASANNKYLQLVLWMHATPKECVVQMVQPCPFKRVRGTKRVYNSDGSAMPRLREREGVLVGRFSNGKTVVDTVTELLGFDDYIPPYANARGRDILTGVNYASAAAGIRDETGQQLGARISFGGQICSG